MELLTLPDTMVHPQGSLIVSTVGVLANGTEFPRAPPMITGTASVMLYTQR